MAGREIPGFYYDATKNKYFKITRDPTVLYSAAAVRKRRAEDAAAADAARLAEVNRRRVTRSRIGCVLEREIGRGSGRVEELRMYVGQWEERDAVGRLRVTRKTRVFDADMELGMIFYSEDGSVLSGAIREKDGVVSLNPVFPLIYGYEDPNCISISADNNCMLSTWAAPNFGVNVMVSGTHEWLDHLISWRIKSSGPGHEETTIRCACAAPISSPYMFAIGTDHHALFLIDKNRQDVPSPIRSKSPTLALTFLSEAPDIVLTGKRSGRIPIIDLRVPEGGNAAIRHATSVARIQQVTEHSVVVAGLQDEMCVYDMRFLRGSGTRENEPTRPVVRMWGHRNETRHDVDLAVDRSAGLVAAAQVEGGGGVRVFDAQSGVEVGYVGGGQPEGEYIRQLRFVAGEKGTALWVGRGDRIVEYAWAGGDDGMA